MGGCSVAEGSAPFRGRAARAGLRPGPRAGRAVTAPPQHGLVHISVTPLRFAPTCGNDGPMTISPHVLGPEGESSARALLDGLRIRVPERLAQHSATFPTSCLELAPAPVRGFPLWGGAARTFTTLSATPMAS